MLENTEKWSVSYWNFNLIITTSYITLFLCCVHQKPLKFVDLVKTGVKICPWPTSQNTSIRHIPSKTSLRSSVNNNLGNLLQYISWLITKCMPVGRLWVLMTMVLWLGIYRLNICPGYINILYVSEVSSFLTKKEKIYQ